ncbi:helix-turn-helix domain-containing protein [Streptomyces sp. NPDC023838]|uniref:helix-turn-helix domain-containing protein n=1 Tax=Streptomyces sp. NPDC023838 TaxID=3154325 RepID=UPI0033FDE43C
MSYQAQTWVDKVGIKQCQNTGELVVLLRVANHTNGDMRGCYASADTLAGECLMGESTVLKHLRRLKAGGALVPGDPKLVSHLRADRRPPVYDLAGGHEPGCPGGHSVDDICRVEATGAQIEHPQKPARATGARSEHPQKKPRSAGVQIEHPSKETPVTGVQIDLSRVFKSSTNSCKDLNSLFSVPAGAFAAPSSQPSHKRERETAPPETAAADVVVAAYEAAAGQRLVSRLRKRLRTDAAEQLARGESVEWLAARAAEMPAKGWLDLARHCHVYRQRQASIPAQSGASAVYGDRPPATPEQVAALRARLAGRMSGL